MSLNLEQGRCRIKNGIVPKGARGRQGESVQGLAVKQGAVVIGGSVRGRGQEALGVLLTMAMMMTSRGVWEHPRATTMALVEKKSLSFV